MSSIEIKTTTIQISRKTKDYLNEIKEHEQLGSYDSVIRVVLLNYKLYKELTNRENTEKKKKDLL